MDINNIYQIGRPKMILIVGVATKTLPVWGQLKFNNREYTVHTNIRGRTDPHNPGDVVGYLFHNDSPDYNDLKNVKSVEIT
jgi:hypothetical protein